MAGGGPRALSSAAGREAAAAFASAGLAVKLVAGALVLTYAAGCLAPEAVVRALSVTPGHFWPPHFWIWTAFTHCFLEVHFWEVILDICVVVLVGKLLEPLWGAVEMLVFFAVVNVGVAMSAAFFYYLLYMLTFDVHLLFDVHIHGLAGYLAGVAVAVRQVMPDYVLNRSPVGKVTNRNVPLLLLALTFVLWAVGAVEGSYCAMFGSGLIVSWVYLRFYQVHANGSKGDMADSFAFHTFFPTVLQPPVALVCNAIFAVLVKLRLCKRPIRRYDMAGPGGGGGAVSISLPGAEPSHDTERRRQIALRALSERLNRGATPPLTAAAAAAQQKSPSPAAPAGEGSGNWPSLDGAPESPAPQPTEVHIPVGDGAVDAAVAAAVAASESTQDGVKEETLVDVGEA